MCTLVSSGSGSAASAAMGRIPMGAMLSRMELTSALHMCLLRR